MTSPFAEIGALLIDKGISAIPIAPGEKYPARFDGARWLPMNEWDRYGARLANHAELDAWESWPGCGVGVALGTLSGVVVVDVDTDDPAIVAAIESVTPGSVVRKKGATGYAAFFRHSGEHSRRFNITVEGNKKKRVVDLLSDGTQTVLPPSRHPDGHNYAWLTPYTLEGVALDELPALPYGYADTLAAALAPWQGSASDAGSGQPLGDVVPEYDISEGEFRVLVSALDTVPYTDYEDFIKIGMCLRDIGPLGFEMWHEWAKRSEHYSPATSPDYLRAKWHGFKVVEGGLGHGTIFKLARQHGWVDPPLPDYAAQLAQGLAEKQRKAAKTGLYGIPAPDLGQLVPPAWIIKKHVVADSLAMLYGPSGVGKSFVALDMGLCVASGRKWQGYDTRPGLVLYVAGEGKAGINARIIAWCRANGVDVETLRDTFIITSQPVPFLDAQRVNELLVVIDGLPSMPVLIIVDTLNRNFGDGDENATKDMTRFVEGLAKIQTLTRACVMPVHHTGKGDSEQARGNSALRAAMDTEMMLKATAEGISLVCTKQKDAAAFNPTGFALEVVTLGHDDDGEEITSCVIKPGQAMQASAAAAAFVEAQRFGTNQRRGLEILRDAVANIRANDPARTLYSIDRTVLQDRLDGTGMTRQRRAEVITWLVNSGVLEDENRFVFVIKDDVLKAAIGG